MTYNVFGGTLNDILLLLLAVQDTTFCSKNVRVVKNENSAAQIRQFNNTSTKPGCLLLCNMVYTFVLET